MNDSFTLGGCWISYFGWDQGAGWELGLRVHRNGERCNMPHVTSTHALKAPVG